MVQLVINIQLIKMVQLLQIIQLDDLIYVVKMMQPLSQQVEMINWLE